jgi:hypothetical protein
MTGTQLIAIGLVIGGGLIWWLRPGSKAIPAQTVGATRGYFRRASRLHGPEPSWVMRSAPPSMERFFMNMTNCI